MKTSAVAVLAAGMVMLMAQDASAFCRSTTCRATADQDCPVDDDLCPSSGAQLFWPTSCVSFALNQDGSADLDPEPTFDTLRKCFETWESVECPGGGHPSMSFVDRGLVSCHTSQYNKTGPNVNVLMFDDDDWKYTTTDATLAKTSVTYNSDTGEIYDADIEINTANNDMTLVDPPEHVSYDLQAIITHETGHFIGLAHSDVDGAVMAPTYTPGTIATRVLTDDDIAAICAVYPPNNGVVCNSDPRGGFSGSCPAPVVKKSICTMTVPVVDAGADGTTASFAVLGIGAVVVIRRGRRRKDAA